MDAFGKEQAAYEAFAKLMNDGRACRALFEAARVPLPAPLMRFLGEGVAPKREPDRKIMVPLPPSPPRPGEWHEGWIWVPVAELTPTSLVRGILRGAAEPLTPRQIVDAISQMGLTAVVGTVANIGTRLASAGEIEREGGAWKMVDQLHSPVIHEGHGWGPPEVFDKYEVAAYRRQLIVHVLDAHPDGLQIIQLTRVLETCDWVRAPLSKDLVKADLHDLQVRKRVRRSGNSGKWRVTSAKEADVSE